MKLRLIVVGIVALVTEGFAQNGNYSLSHFNPLQERSDYLSFDLTQDDRGIIYIAGKEGVEGSEDEEEQGHGDIDVDQAVGVPLREEQAVAHGPREDERGHHGGDEQEDEEGARLLPRLHTREPAQAPANPHQSRVPSGGRGLRGRTLGLGRGRPQRFLMAVFARASDW